MDMLLAAAEFEEVKEQCRALAGGDDAQYRKLLLQHVAGRNAEFYIEAPPPPPLNLLQVIQHVQIPTKRRGSNVQQNPIGRVYPPVSKTFFECGNFSGSRTKVPKPKSDEVPAPDSELVTEDVPAAATDYAPAILPKVKLTRREKGKWKAESEFVPEDVPDADTDCVPGPSRAVKPTRRDKGEQKVESEFIPENVPDANTDCAPAPSRTVKPTRRDKGKRKAEGGTGNDGTGKKKRSVPKKVDFTKMGLEPPPGLPQELIDLIERRGGKDVKLVVMKNLSKTDVTAHHERLSIPEKQVRDGSFLTPKESVVLEGGEAIGVDLVMAAKPEVTYPLKLIYWKVNSQYALRSGWNGVVQENSRVLTENSIVQLWSFREGDGKLCFLLVKIGDAEDDAPTAVCGGGKGGGRNDRKDKGGDGAGMSGPCNNGCAVA